MKIPCSLKTPRSFWFVAVLLWRMAVESVRGAEVTSRPNILFILADDLSANCLSAYGNDWAKTPTLDRLAAEGAVFTHCYSTPLCMPSRTELMTGKYTHRNFNGGMPKGEKTIAQTLKAQGYVTCQISKWHMNFRGGQLPSEAGFDEWYWSELENNYGKLANQTKRGLVINENGKEVVYPDGYGPDIRTDITLDFMTRHKDQPMFIYAAMHLPHDPMHVPPGFTVPEHPEKSIPYYRDRYMAMIEQQDKEIGRMLDKLDELGIRNNTIVLFSGDNGTPQGIFYPFQGKTINGGKGKMIDAGTRVPLIANWPGKIAAGTRLDDLVDFSDFFATFADAAGAPRSVWAGTDGVSFLPRLFGQPGTPREWAFLFYKNNRGKPIGCWARTREWKLYGDGRLYDLRADPDEAQPIPPESQPEVRRKLARVFTNVQVPPAFAPAATTAP